MANPLSQLDEAGDAVRKVIRAYHGSPYDFDRFDASKIGTGEGVQAYGHGLYFADAEDAAKHYKTVQTPELTLEEERELAAAVKRMRDLKALTEIIPKTDPRAEQLISEWGQLRDRRARLEDHPGHMYEVEIGYPQSEMLDYDRPFSNPVGVVGAEVLRQHNPAAIGQGSLRAIQDGSWRFESHRGRSPYETAAVELTRLAKTRGGAQALVEAGIPGVRYLDGISRGAGKGSRNYVMFPGTEDSIRILRKYGMMAPIAAGATAGE